MVERTENLVIIDDTVHGSYMPSSKNRLLTDVVLREGFHIEGGLYANNLTVEGPGRVDGPVMARRDIIIHPPPREHEKRIVFKSGISAKLAISVEVPNTYPYNPLNSENFIPLLIRGDVVAQSVHLENAVVVGNVFAGDAVIKDSIILGLPLIDNRLVFRNSMALSFRAGAVHLEGRNSLWVPYGLATSDIKFEEYRRDQEEDAQVEVSKQGVADWSEAEDAGKAWVRYLGLCQQAEIGCGKPGRLLICPHHMSGACHNKDVRMGEQDKVRFKRGDKRLVALTVAPRFVDLQRIQKDLSEMVELLSNFFFLDHYTAESRNRVLASLKDTKRAGPLNRPLAHYKLLENVARFTGLSEPE